jgi:RNA polymerase sigma-70 factor, ECF subfamily
MTEKCVADGEGAADRRDAADGHGAADRTEPAAVVTDGLTQDGTVVPNPTDDVPRLVLEQFVAEHADALYRYAFRLTGAAADAEDLTQQTFLIAHRKFDQLRDLCSARVWLMTVMRRAYCRSRMKSGRERERTVPLDFDSLPADEVSDRWEIDRELLQTAIDELPDEFKLVLLGFYFENRSYREMAEQFELPMGTVMSRLARAKSHLRSRLFEAELAGAESQGTAVRDGSIPPRRGGK